MEDRLEDLSEKDLLLRVARELKTIRELVGQGMFALRDAEREIPEKLRRFMNYCHDVHAMKFMYEEVGHQAPDWVMNELQRVDDRYRQIIGEMKSEGGPINKVIREMAKDPTNRWDHTKQLPKPTENVDARQSGAVKDGIDESRTAINEGQPSSGSGVGDS